MTDNSEIHGASPLTSLLRLIDEHHRVTRALAEQAALLGPLMSPDDCQTAADRLDDVAGCDTAYVVLQRRANEAIEPIHPAA